MKWLLTLLVIMVLLAACSSEQEEKDDVLNETDSSDSEIDEEISSKQATDDDFIVEELTQEDVVNDYLDEVADLDSVTLDFDVLLAGVKVTSNKYTEDETQELRFSLDSPVKEAILSFDLVCDDDIDKMVVTVNDFLSSREELSCGNRVSISLKPDLFIDNFNVLSLQMHVEGDTYGEDVNLSFVTEEKSFSWEGKRLEFESIDEDEREEKVLGALDSIRFQSVIRRTFKVNKEKLTDDLLLKFNGDRQDGKVQVLLNEKEIFSDSIDDENELVLSIADLVDGRNELLFVLLG